MKSKVVIIGCGWVGKALIPLLVEQQYQVLATTRSVENFADIKQKGATPIKLELPTNDEADFEFLAGTQTLIISLTPQFKHGREDYPAKVKSIVEQATKCKISRIILLSSTGVYQGVAGEVDETTSLKLTVHNVNLLSQAEQQVLSAGSTNCVLRLAGLVGPKRHPARFMAGKTQLPNANTPINLVHQSDVVNAILLLIKQSCSQGIYNVVSDEHPPRSKFYQQACQQLGLVPPTFSDEQEQHFRIVNGNKIKAHGLTLTHSDLMSWIEN